MLPLHYEPMRHICRRDAITLSVYVLQGLTGTTKTVYASVLQAQLAIKPVKAAQSGLEPLTSALTVRRSAIELLNNMAHLSHFSAIALSFSVLTVT